MQIFDVEHLSIVLPILRCDVVGEAAVVSAAGENPRTGTDLEVRLWNPQGVGNRELRQWFRFDAVYIVDDESEAVAHVDYRCRNAVANL